MLPCTIYVSATFIRIKASKRAPAPVTDYPGGAAPPPLPPTGAPPRRLFALETIARMRACSSGDHVGDCGARLQGGYGGGGRRAEPRESEAEIGEGRDNVRGDRKKRLRSLLLARAARRERARRAGLVAAW